jgi:hypothetical protein
MITYLGLTPDWMALIGGGGSPLFNQLAALKQRRKNFEGDSTEL